MTRTRLLTICLSVLMAGTLLAQETTTTAATAATTTAETTAASPGATPPANETDSRQIREEFRALLEQYPPQLGRVLKLDPSLLSNASYLANYPAIATFLTQHPEVAHSPSFFLEGVSSPDFVAEPPAVRMWRGAMEGMSIFALVLLWVGVLTWLVRTVIDHRRWSRVTRLQAEVHGKLMDRLTSNEDLLAYMQTPAGKRFLESAPIMLDGPRAVSAPIGRVLWSVQVGVVLVSLGLGLLFVSRSIEREVSGPMSAMGVVGLSIGLGFVLSAIVSFVLSRRLGLLDGPGTPEGRPVAE